MPKQKTNKTVLKRVKITSTGKVLRRHQLASGHLKRNKSKGALEQHQKPIEYFKGEFRVLKKVLGI